MICFFVENKDKYDNTCLNPLHAHTHKIKNQNLLNFWIGWGVFHILIIISIKSIVKKICI